MHAPKTFATAGSSSQARVSRLPGVSVPEARTRLLAALRAHGFTVTSDINLAALLDRRLDTKMETYLTVEACHPKLAQLALAVASDAGLLASFRFGIWKEGAGAAVATLAPARLGQALGRDHLAPVLSQAERQLDEVFAGLDRPAVAEPLPADPLGVMLDASERAALKDEGNRRLEALLAEAAGTDSRDLQHGLAKEIECLERIIHKL
jgi:uncharacterized protein (DUF302 family)